MDEENVQKLSIHKEEVHPLERIFSEQEIEQSYEFNLNGDQSFLETRRIDNKYGLSSKSNEKLESNEILTTAKNKSPPFRRRNINQQQDKELLETLFNQTASRKSVVSIKKIENAKEQQDPNFLKSKKSFSKSNFKQSQSEFLSRIQIFLNRKKNHLQEKIIEEKQSHNPVLTYKGYMSKSKSIDELAYGNFQKKHEFMEKMKNEIIKKELSQLKQPQINRNIEISSKLGLGLPTKEYIKNLEIKNLAKQQIQNSKEKKILEELQNCSYKPQTIPLNKNIIRKKIVDKKQYNDNLTNSYIKINGKNKENINKIQNLDFSKPKTQKYHKIFEESKIKEPNDYKKCENKKKLTVFEESILKIKEEIRSLL